MNLKNYKVENLEILNMPMKRLGFAPSHPTIFQVENEVTLSKKIEFIDSVKDGVATYLIELFEKWDVDRATLPKQYGDTVKTVSEKAWIKRNDSRNIVNKDYSVGAYYLFGTQFSSMSLECSKLDYRNNIIYPGEHIAHQWFHDLLLELKFKEQVYFNSIDPKSIKLNKVRMYIERFNITFDNQEISDIHWNRKSEVEETNLDKYIAAFEKLEKAVEQIKIEGGI